MLPLFAPKQTFARIDYLQQGGRLVGKKALIMLNFLLKSRQKQLLRIYASSKIALITSPMVCPSTLKRVGYWNFSKLILIPNWHMYNRVCVNWKPGFINGRLGVMPILPPTPFHFSSPVAALSSVQKMGLQLQKHLALLHTRFALAA